MLCELSVVMKEIQTVRRQTTLSGTVYFFLESINNGIGYRF